MIRELVRWNRDIANRLMQRYPTVFDGPNYGEDLIDAIRSSISEGDCVLEVGGIDRPMLRHGEGYIYDGMDIEEREECFTIYDSFLVQSVEQSVEKKYDHIVSITLLEHVRNNTASVGNMYQALNPGGRSLHYIPSKWHPYSISLRIVGPTWQKRLIPILRPGTEDVTGYPAFFDKCSAPAMKSLFLASGFRDVRITPYYRANDYFAFFLPFYLLVSLFENVCRKLGLS